MAELPYTFTDVERGHEIAKTIDPRFRDLPLRDFARFMNQSLGTDAFKAGDTGIVGRTIKKISSQIDTELEPLAEPLGKVGESVVGGIGSLFGARKTGEEIGRSVGENFPRIGLEAASLASPYTRAIGLADVFAKSYTETGSPLAGAISATTFGLAPLVGGKAASVAGQGISKMVGGAIAPRIGQTAARFGERLIEKGAGTAGMLGTFEVGGELESLAAGHGLYNPLEARHIGQALASILPFEIGGLPSLARGYRLKGGKPKPVGVRDMFKREIPDQVGSLAEYFRMTEQAREQAGRANVDLQSEIKREVEKQEVTEKRIDVEVENDFATLGDAIGAKIKPGMTGAQLLKELPLEWQPEVPGGDNVAKARHLKKEFIEPFESMTDKALTTTIEGIVGQKKGDLPPGEGTDVRSSKDPFSKVVASIVPEAPTLMGTLLGFEGPQTARIGWQAIINGSDLVRVQKEAASKGVGVVRVEVTKEGKWVPTEKPLSDVDSVFFYIRDQGMFEKSVKNTHVPIPIAKEKVKKRIAELEAQGIPPEQLARAADILSKLKVTDPTEEINQVAMREAGLDAILLTKVPPEQVMKGVESFFRKMFTNNGEIGERLEYMTNLSLLTTMKFSEAVKDFRLTSTGSAKDFNFFMQIPGGKASNVVSIVPPEGRELSVYKWLAHNFAHELTHAAQVTNNPNYLKAVAATKELTDQEKTLAIRSLLKHTDPLADLNLKHWNYGTVDRPGESTHEFLADYTATIVQGASVKNNQALKDFWRFSSKDEQDFLGGIIKDASQSIDSIGAYFNGLLRSAPKTQQADIGKLVDALHEVHKNLVSMLKTDEEVRWDFLAYRSLQQRMDSSAISEPPIVTWKQAQRYGEVYTKLYNEQIPKVSPTARQETNRVLEEIESEVVPTPVSFGKRTAWYHWLFPWTQFAKDMKDLPTVADSSSLAMDFRRIASQATQERWKFFQDDKGKFDEGRLRRLAKKGTRLNQAFTKVGLRMQVEEKMILGEELKGYLKEEFPGITDQEVRDLDKSFQQLAMATKTGQVQLVKGDRERVENAVSLVLMSHDPTMKWKDAEMLGTQVISSVFDGTINPLEVQAQLVAQIGARVTNSETMGMITKLAQEGYQQHQKFQKHMLGEDLQGKGWWMPEVRTGAWHIAWKEKGGKPMLVAYASKKEADTRLASLNGRQVAGKLEYLKAFNKEDKLDVYRGMDPSWIDSFVKADQAFFNSVTSKLAQGDPLREEVVRELREQFTPGDGAYMVLASPYMHKRRLVGGREELNMIEGVVNHIDSTSHSLAKRFVKQKQRLLLKDPEMVANDNVRNKVKLFLTNLTDPQGTEFTKLKNFVTMNYLYLNPSSLPIEMSQLLTTVVPHLVQGGSTIGGAYKALVSAMGEVAHPRLGKYKVKDPELQRYLDRAEQDGELGVGFLSDLYSLEDSQIASKRSLTSGDGHPLDPRTLASNSAYHMMKFGRDMYGIGTRFNAAVTYTAAFRLAKARGFDGEAANMVARDAIHTALFSGGTANRPLALSKWGGMQGVGGLMYTLQSYTFNTLSMMARIGKEAYHGDKASQKAFATMITTQFLLGGLMGMPFVAGGIAVLEQLFPDLQIKKNMRDMFHQVANDDEKMGHLLADGAMSGVFNAVGPVDVGARFQLGNMFGIDPYKGFSLSNLLGPTMGMLENWVGAGKDVVAGKPGDGFQKVLPAGLRGAARLAIDEGHIRDKQGRLLFEPTTSEATLLALGFKPKRLNQHYEAQAIRLRGEESAARKLNSFYQEQATLLLDGRQEQVRQNLIEQEKEVQRFDPKVALNRIIELAQERTTPVDLFRTGMRSTATERGRLAQLYPHVEGPTEIQKLIERDRLAQSFGIPGYGLSSQRSISHAQAVDEMMQVNPLITRDEASRIVKKAMSRARPFQLSQ